MDTNQSMLLLTVDDALDVLRSGKPLIFQTDTVCGIGISVGHNTTPSAIYAAKRRVLEKPVSWLIPSGTDLQKYAEEIPDYASALIETSWPGATTLIFKASDAVPASFTSATHTLGFRVPDCSRVLELMRLLGSPLCTSSANFAGDDAAATLPALDRDFLESSGVVCLAPGPYEHPSGHASKVIDCTGPEPKVLRQ